MFQFTSQRSLAFCLVENPPPLLQVLWQEPKVVFRDVGMRVVEAGDVFLEMLVSCLLHGQFSWKRCPRFAVLLDMLVRWFPAAETDFDGTESEPSAGVGAQVARAAEPDFDCVESGPSGGAGARVARAAVNDFDDVKSESSAGSGAWLARADEVDLHVAQLVLGAGFLTSGCEVDTNG